MKDFYENALNLIFPIDEYCMFCRRRCKPYRHYLCERCYEELDRNFYSCKYCGVGMQERSFGICEDCIEGRSDFSGFIKTYFLSEASKRAVYRYKNGRKRELSYAFASLLAERIRARIDPRAFDFIVSVPASKKKLRMRGFDHVKEIAKRLSDLLGLPYEELLERSYEVKEQKRLDKKERFENMKEAFSLKKYSKEPISLLLIDDIITTGATMKACAKVLHQLDAKIYGACVFQAGGEDTVRTAR